MVVEFLKRNVKPDKPDFKGLVIMVVLLLVTVTFLVDIFAFFEKINFVNS
jgi:hypothetical protein